MKEKLMILILTVLLAGSGVMHLSSKADANGLTGSRRNEVRQYMAGQALTGLLAYGFNRDYVVQESYRLADKMLKHGR